jgi:hypothetical protein
VAIWLRAALLAATTLVAGCDYKTPKAVGPDAPAVVGDLRADAAALAARGDYVAAEKKYREALRAQPDDVDLHFGLGSVLSQLDRRQEAIEEFQWVVKNGRPGRPEVDSARRWLAEAGAGGSASTVASATPAAPEPGTTGGVTGKLTWPGLPTNKQFAIRIVVERNSPGDIRKSVRSKLNGTFAVEELPEGTYKVTGLAGHTRIWSDLPVTVTAGRQTTLDLGPSNATASAAEVFPSR